MEQLTDGLKKISTTTKRKFSEEEIDVLVDELDNLSGKRFEVLVDDYCHEEKPPRNVLGYFWKHAGDVLKPEKEKGSWEPGNNGASDPDYPVEAVPVLEQCYRKIKELAVSGGIRKDDICTTELFRRWNNLPYSRMVVFFTNVEKKLNEMIANKSKAQIINFNDF